MIFPMEKRNLHFLSSVDATMPLNFGIEYVRLNVVNKTSSIDDGPGPNSTTCRAFSGFSAHKHVQNLAKMLFSLTDDKPLVLRHILMHISTA